MERLKTAMRQFPREFGRWRSQHRDFADHAFHSLIQLLAHYQHSHEENLVYRRRMFFREALLGERNVEAAQWREELERMHLPFHLEPFCVVLVEIDKYGRFSSQYSQKDQKLLKYATERAVSELAAAGRFALWAEWLDKNRLGLLFLKSRFHSGQLPDVAEVCERFRLWVREHLKFSVTIGVGDPVNGAENVSLSYEQAREALTKKMVCGTDRVILYRDIRTHRDIRTQAADSPMPEYLAEIQDMARMFRTGDPAWRDAFRRLFRDGRLNRLDRDDAVTLINMLLFTFHREMMEMPAEYRRWWKNNVMSTLTEATAHFESVDEAGDAFYQALTAYEAQLKRARESRQTAAVFEQMRRYIDENYANPDLSLAHLGSVFNISPKYISYIFKEQSGVNFVDYLAQIRMERAKRLLLTTNDPIPDIAARVGYLHAVSFNRVFKKIVGTTPGEFRNRQKTG